MDLEEQYTQWSKQLSQKLCNIKNWQQRYLLVLKEFTQTSPEAAAFAAERYITKAYCTRANPDTIAAQSVLVSNILNLWDPQFRAQTREAAAFFEYQLTLTFLSDVAPPADDLSNLEVPVYGKERPLTLGERKSLAIKPSRDLIKRAVADPHPMVIAKLLDNAHLTEADVLQMAANQTALASTLFKIGTHMKWRFKPRIARSLALNVSVSTQVTLSLLPFLFPKDITDIIRDGRLNQTIRNAAALLSNTRQSQ